MIKNLTNLNQTLSTGDAAGWARKVGNELRETTQNPGVAKEIGDTKSFGDFLQDSISQVNNLQVEANDAMTKLASGESRDMHETLLAVEKAEIAFKAMNQVRSKVIDAYKEIMRMQI